MARIRSLKPEALQHRKIGRLSDRAFRVWIGMLSQADDEGRLIVDPESFRVLFFGYHPKVKTGHVITAINEVVSLGSVRLYGISHTIYADFPSWQDHQVVNRPSPSFFPPYEQQYAFMEYPVNNSGTCQHDRPDLIGPDLIGPDLTQEAVNIPALAHRDAFERFWTAYPKKTAKGYAHTCFLRAIERTTLEVMLRAIEVQRNWPQWQRDGGQYIPNPSTWLNQGRWEDEPPKVRAPKITPKMAGTMAALEDFAHGGNGSDPVRGDVGGPRLGVQSGAGPAHD